MAHSHYVMDLYYPLDGRSEQYRRDVLRIDAADDAEALAEARRVDQWRNPSHYHLRAIRNSARSGDRLLLDSRTDKVPEDAVIEVTSSAIEQHQVDAGAAGPEAPPND